MLYPAWWKKITWSEQSPEKSTVLIVPFFVGHPVYIWDMRFYMFEQQPKKKIKIKIKILFTKCGKKWGDDIINSLICIIDCSRNVSFKITKLHYVI